MAEYTISNDFLEIVSETSNRLHPAYMEASKNVDANNDKAFGYIKNFITSIENIASKTKAKSSKISESKGNIKNFTSYEDIKTALGFLTKNLGKIPVVESLSNILKALESFQPQYTEGYEKQVRLVILEYESAVDLLVTGITMTMAEGIDVVHNGTSIKIKKNNVGSSGIINKTIIDLAKQMNDKQHKQYLDEIIKSKSYVGVSTSVSESAVFTEGVVSETLDLINAVFSNAAKIGKLSMNMVKSIKKSFFGIIPLIRACMYIKYKRKADAVLNLEQQVEFITQNIEQLQNRTNIDPKEKEAIIKRQRATIEAFQKRAAKLRAELSDCERETAAAVKAENPGIKNTDDDFVLEGGVTLRGIFAEKTDE